MVHAVQMAPGFLALQGCKLGKEKDQLLEFFYLEHPESSGDPEAQLDRPHGLSQEIVRPQGKGADQGLLVIAVCLDQNIDIVELLFPDRTDELKPVHPGHLQ
ncbi:MAG: hypothetical protein ACD_74C00298G0001, partial [uncultured bacterium]